LAFLTKTKHDCTCAKKGKKKPLQLVPGVSASLVMWNVNHVVETFPNSRKCWTSQHDPASYSHTGCRYLGSKETNKMEVNAV